MKRVILLAAVLMLLGAGSAGASVKVPVAYVSRVILRERIAVPLSPTDKPANLRVYNCHPRSCQFTVHGTAVCMGKIRVRESRANYVGWIARMRCQN